MLVSTFRYLSIHWNCPFDSNSSRIWGTLNTASWEIQRSDWRRYSLFLLDRIKLISFLFSEGEEEEEEGEGEAGRTSIEKPLEGEDKEEEEDEDEEEEAGEEGEGAHGDEEGAAVDEEGGAAPAQSSRKKKLVNQFNFCERATLTYMNPTRVSWHFFSCNP